jgi:hypothetical protein
MKSHVIYSGKGAESCVRSSLGSSGWRKRMAKKPVAKRLGGKPLGLSPAADLCWRIAKSRGEIANVKNRDKLFTLRISNETYSKLLWVSLKHRVTMTEIVLNAFEPLLEELFLMESPPELK